MVKYSKILINNIVVKDDGDVNDPSQIISWDYPKTEDQPVTEAELVTLKSITDYTTVNNGDLVQIFVSNDAVTWVRRFYGFIDNAVQTGTTNTLKCKNKMGLLVREIVNQLYNSSGPQGGVISAIAENIVQDGGLSTNFQNSGTAQILSEFKCINANRYERVKTLIKDSLDWALYYDDENDEVVAEPQGYVDSGITITTGQEIVAVPEWTADTSNLINDLRIDGAVTDTTITESGKVGTTAGYQTDSLLLTKTPNSVELYMDASNPPTTQRVGGTQDSTTGNFYWVDRENKKVMPATGTSFTNANYAKINYVWSAPAPIHMRNDTSITDWGLAEKQLTINDIKNIADAEARGREILAKQSRPYLTGKLKVKSTVALVVGQLINIVDNITPQNVSGTYMILSVDYKYPNGYEEITVGDKIWRTADWQEKTETRLKRLEENLVRNDDLITELIDNNALNADNFIPVQPRYHKVVTQNMAGNTLIWGNPSFGTWGSFYWGGSPQTSFVLGHPSAGVLGTSKLGSQLSAETDYFVAQYLNTYTERFLDTDFKDASTNATWNTTTKQLTFTAGQIAQSTSIDMRNGTISQAKFNGTINSGTFLIEMTADGTNWETVINNVIHIFTNPGTDLRWRITENGGGTGVITNVTVDNYH